MEERRIELLAIDLVNCAAMYNIERIWEQPNKQVEMSARMDGIIRTAEIFGYAPILEHNENGAIVAVHIMRNGKEVKKAEVWVA